MHPKIKTGNSSGPLPLLFRGHYNKPNFKMANFLVQAFNRVQLTVGR